MNYFELLQYPLISKGICMSQDHAEKMRKFDIRPDVLSETPEHTVA